MLTLFRIILAIISFALFLVPEAWTRVTALVLFILAAITDKIDGYLARRTNQVTDLGAFLDPLADKILVDLFLVALLCLDIVPPWALAVILVRDLIIDGLRMTAAKHSETIAASFSGKLKTTVQLIAIILLMLRVIVSWPPLVVIGNTALYIAVFLTVLSGII